MSTTPRTTFSKYAHPQAMGNCWCRCRDNCGILYLKSNVSSGETTREVCDDILVLLFLWQPYISTYWKEIYWIWCGIGTGGRLSLIFGTLVTKKPLKWVHKPSRLECKGSMCTGFRCRNMSTALNRTLVSLPDSALLSRNKPDLADLRMALCSFCCWVKIWRSTFLVVSLHRHSDVRSCRFAAAISSVNHEGNSLTTTLLVLIGTWRSTSAESSRLYSLARDSTYVDWLARRSEWQMFSANCALSMAVNFLNVTVCFKGAGFRGWSQQWTPQWSERMMTLLWRSHKTGRTVWEPSHGGDHRCVSGPLVAQGSRVLWCAWTPEHQGERSNPTRWQQWQHYCPEHAGTCSSWILHRIGG